MTSQDPTEPTKGSGLVLTPKPMRRVLPNLPRDIQKVDPKLVDLFRRLAVGEAKLPLYLHGPVGSGKTLASLCLADMTETAVYRTVEDLCDEVMAGDAGEVATTWAAIETTELAILDELGTRKNVGDLHYGVVKRFSDARELSGNRPAIYISNISPDGLRGVYDARINSRILCGTWFELVGKDRRFDYGVIRRENCQVCGRYPRTPERECSRSDLA